MTSKIKTNPRNKRWGKTKRGKRSRFEDTKSFLNVSYFQTRLYPDKTEPLGLDIEFIKDKTTNKLLPAWVAICQDIHNQKRRKSGVIDTCIYQSKVFHILKNVDLMTKYSGITKHMIKSGRGFNTVRSEVEYYLKHYLIVGANIKKDLESLNLEHYLHKTIDIQRDKNFYHGKNGTNDAIKLRTLAYAVMNKKIQEFSEKRVKQFNHSPIMDARVAVKLYKRRLRKLVESESDEEGGKSFEWAREKVNSVPEFKTIVDKERVYSRKRRKNKKRKH